VRCSSATAAAPGGQARPQHEGCLPSCGRRQALVVNATSHCTPPQSLPRPPASPPKPPVPSHPPGARPAPGLGSRCPSGASSPCSASHTASGVGLPPGPSTLMDLRHFLQEAAAEGEGRRERERRGVRPEVRESGWVGLRRSRLVQIASWQGEVCAGGVSTGGVVTNCDHHHARWDASVRVRAPPQAARMLQDARPALNRSASWSSQRPVACHVEASYPLFAPTAPREGCSIPLSSNYRQHLRGGCRYPAARIRAVGPPAPTVKAQQACA
jgi:hypothetical protein